MKSTLEYYWNEIQSIFSFQWENPLFLYLLPLPLFIYLIKNVWQNNKRAKISLSFAQPLVQNKLTRLLSFIPEIIQSAILLSLIIAISEPYESIIHHKKEAQGIDIAIAIDLSSSMLTKDVYPSRLEVAKKVAKKFIQKRQMDPIALIAFAGEPYLACPITLDNKYLQGALGALESNLIPEEGTALGDALGMCLNQIRDNPKSKKICILISDGKNTTGNLDPNISAKLAQTFKIKVYTIAVGSNNTNIDPIDESTLRSIATQTDGKFFRATDSNALQKTFNEIDYLEKTKVNNITWEERIDQSTFFIQLAFLLFICGMILRLTWINNMLED
jgi:Ca-activated chloride channel family protein